MSTDLKERDIQMEELDIPKMDPISLFKQFGPGVILMMTGVGTSHLVSAPTAGGRFEFALLWAVLLSYIFKYYGFQMAFRFTNATGKSIMDAMCTTKGKWAIWYVLVITIIQAAIGQAGRVIAAAAVLYFGFTEFGGLTFDVWVYALVISLISVGLVLAGKYSAVEAAAKVFIAILVVSGLFVFFVNPTPAWAYRYFVILDIPAGSWLVLAAFVGLLPTGIDVALQASEWGKAKKKGLPLIRDTLEEKGLAGKFDSFNPKWEDIPVDTTKLSPHVKEYCDKWFKIGVYDFTFGHVVSFILVFIFISLAAVWMYPSAVEGRAVMGEIARIFTDSVGPWMMWIFLLGALAATWSTTINYFDGWPRVIAASARNLFKGTAELSGIEEGHSDETRKKTWYSEYNIWRIAVIYSLIASVGIIIGLPRPVWLVLVASALALIISPILFYLHIVFCLKGIPKEDKVFYPSPGIIIFSWISFVVFTIMMLGALAAEFGLIG